MKSDKRPLKWNFWKTQLFWQSLLLEVRESAREPTVTFYRLLDFVNQRGKVERGQLHALPHEADDSNWGACGRESCDVH
jgi:hypothetical protein